MSYDEAFAACCFPYDMIYYVDPITGSLVVNGELWNNSYKVEPFGNAKYEFVFANSTGDALFERELFVTDGHPIHDGFVINPLGAHPLPFQMVIDDIDSEILNQVAYVGTGRTHVDYFPWKPTDLNATLTEFKKIETIQGQTHDALFDKWQVSGTITNMHYDATQNVYVLASLYESEHRLVGVAGYSNDDIQPKTLNGHETKEFRIHALISQEKSVKQVRLYAESDESSMEYPHTKPIILKPDVQIKHGMKGISIPISVNVTNISRENVDFDWFLQIKKSPKSLDEGDITKYPESKIAFIDMVHVGVAAQESTQLEYLWTPVSGGIYFYEMYLWDDGLPVSLAFTGSFLYSDQILITSNSIKEQLKSGSSFENLQCMYNLVLIQKYDAAPACVKPETLTKLVERGWAAKYLGNADTTPTIISGLQVDVTGQQQIRRGTTHDIVVDVARDGYVVSDALVRITIEDYGENVIRDFKGRTDDSGRFVFSWEIPKSFDDIKTLLAFVDVTDDISAKTILFKFQVYCLPGEIGCKVEGN